MALSSGCGCWNGCSTLRSAREVSAHSFHILPLISEKAGDVLIMVIPETQQAEQKHVELPKGKA